MKALILIPMLALLTACGANGIMDREIKQPVDIPASWNYRNPVIRSYSVLASNGCRFRIDLANGQELPYQSYGYTCEYNEGGYVTKVIVEYYSTLPSVGYLIYTL